VDISAPRDVAELSLSDFPVREGTAAVFSAQDARKGGDPMSAKLLSQLAFCDYCQEREADRCHIRLKTHMCPRCTVFIEAATGEHLTVEREVERAA
jgi:hypothetical protein